MIGLPLDVFGNGCTDEEVVPLPVSETYAELRNHLTEVDAASVQVLSQFCEVVWCLPSFDGGSFPNKNPNGFAFGFRASDGLAPGRLDFVPIFPKRESRELRARFQ